MEQRIKTFLGTGILVIVAVTAVVFVAVYWKKNPIPEVPIKNIPVKMACTEEAKLCPDGTYVSRTGPKCEFTACPAITGIENKIIITSPKSSDIVGSPVSISGRVVGTWFFEASFPVEIYDGNNKLIGQGIASFIPKSEADTWMTEDFVDFSGNINFSQPTTSNGFIVFKKDNPSDLPSLEEAFRMPIKFSELSEANGLSWRNYQNEKYGFELGFPETWKGYTVTPRKLDWGNGRTSDSLDFGFPAQKDGLFNISFHTPKQYKELLAEGGPIGQKLGENNGYVFLWDSAQYAANKDMEARMKEIKSIIETFQLIVDRG